MKSPLWIALLLVAPLAYADGKPNAADPIGSKLFPPDLIVAHQSELGIEDKQRDAIVAEVQKTQAQTLGIEWQLRSATDAMVKLLDGPRVDESKVLAQADKLMALDREFKRGQLGMLVRIRNLLTDGQRARLAELRKAAP